MAAKIIMLLMVSSVMLQVVFCHPAKRQINTDEIKNSDERICGSSTPCGWAIYNKYSRNVDYFMKNQCSCATDLQCIRDDDDISINAFVYRCKSKKS